MLKSLSQIEFEKILNYIYKTDKFDYLNISMGIVNYGNISKLDKVCTLFNKNGTCIVSDFNNEETVSFPATTNNAKSLIKMMDVLCKRNFVI